MASYYSPKSARQPYEQPHWNHYSSNFPLFQALPVGQDWSQNFCTCFTFRSPNSFDALQRLLSYGIPSRAVISKFHHSLLLEVPRFDAHRFDWSHRVARVNRALWSYGQGTSPSMVSSIIIFLPEHILNCFQLDSGRWRYEP